MTNTIQKYGFIIPIVICIVIIVVCCYCYCGFWVDNTIHVHSRVNGRPYKVRKHEDFDTQQNAADYLAEVSGRVDNLVKYMMQYQLPNEEVAHRLANRWEGCTLRETHSGEDSAAYTINKGDEMRLCIRKDENTLENINTSMFVVLHELAHVMSISYGHNEEFRNNFSFIVHLASALGYYKPEEFGSEPVDYCGTEINTTPCMSGMCEYTTIPTIEPIVMEGFGVGLGERGFNGSNMGSRFVREYY